MPKNPIKPSNIKKPTPVNIIIDMTGVGVSEKPTKDDNIKPSISNKGRTKTKTS